MLSVLRTLRPSRALRVFVLECVVCGAVAAGVLAAIIPARNVPINIRWRPDVTSSQRVTLEQRFHLTNARQTEGTTWAYELTDPSVTNIHAIVRDANVDDTAHIHRRFFRPEFAFDRAARIAIASALFGGVASLLLLVRSTAALAMSRTVRVPERTLMGILGTAPVLLLALSVLMLVVAVAYQPLWANRTVTLSQAAAGADSATVFRMVNAGSDPNAVAPVLLGRRTEAVMLTPLEAAVESREVDVVQLLLKMGARATESDRQRLACLATAVGAGDVATYLHTAAPPATLPDCASIALPAH